MNAVTMFVPWFSLTITITLLHLLWIGVLIVAFAAIANRCLARRSANSRYLLHFALLVLMFLCVPATLAFVATAVRSDRTLAAIVLQRLLEAVWFFHPAAWYISRRLSHERENCCDDLVIEVGAGRVSYAESLYVVSPN